MMQPMPISQPFTRYAGLAGGKLCAASAAALPVKPCTVEFVKFTRPPAPSTKRLPTLTWPEALPLPRFSKSSVPGAFRFVRPTLPPCGGIDTNMTVPVPSSDDTLAFAVKELLPLASGSTKKKAPPRLASGSVGTVGETLPARPWLCRWPAKSSLLR